MTLVVRVVIVLVVVWLAAVAPAEAQLNNRRAARPEVNLTDGPARRVILGSCTACHGIDDYAYNALDRVGWNALVDTMVDKGAAIAEKDRLTLLDWLVAEFGPDSTPFPRDYVISPVDSGLFADDDAARDYLGATCAVCHSLDRVETARFAEDRWEATVADMKVRGAAVADENVEALVDYLARKHGSD